MKLKSSLWSSLALPALALWLIACGDGNTDVRHYRVTKAPVAAPAAPNAPAMPTPPPAMPAAPPGRSPGAVATGLTWTAPEGWKAAPPSSMRLASFEVPVEGGAGDLSVVRLGGDAGGFVANINRWRGQIGLAPAEEAAIREVAKEGTSPLGPFTAVKLANPDGPKGMLAAVYALDGATLFVKLSAPTPAIDGLEQPFLDFCASIAEARQ